MMMALSPVVSLFLATAFCGAAHAETPLGSGINRGASATSCSPHGESGACTQQRIGRTLLQHAAGVSDLMLSTEVGSTVETSSSIAESNQSPGGIKDYINGQLLPEEEQTKMELQQEVTRAASGYEACVMDLANVEDSFRQQEQTLTTAEQRHSECETKVEMGNRSEVEFCGDLDNFATALTPPLDLSTVNGSDVAALVQALSTMNDYFNDVYPQIKQKKQKCEMAKTEEVATQEQCDADKKSIETSWCSLKAERVRACSSFDTCFSSKDKKFDEVVKYVKQGEELSKDNFKTLACHGDKNCSTTDSDASHLSVSYPIKPEKRDCDPAVKTNWDYADVQCDGEEPVTADATPAHL